MDSRSMSVDPKSNDLAIRGPGEADGPVLFKIFRKKLQYFLMTSTEYHAEKILRLLPAGRFLHEYALVLSRLGQHEEVLKIYIHEVDDLALAEEYCQRTYLYDPSSSMILRMIPCRCRRALEEKDKKAKGRHGARLQPSYVPEDSAGAGSIYLSLVKVLLTSNQPSSTRIETVVSIAEKYYDRMNPLALLGELPGDVPIAVIARYLSIVLEFANAKKRNLQIIHQLLRVREVNIRTSQSSSAASS